MATLVDHIPAHFEWYNYQYSRECVVVDILWYFVTDESGVQVDQEKLRVLRIKPGIVEKLQAALVYDQTIHEGRDVPGGKIRNILDAL